MGFYDFFRELFNRMGIELTPGTEHWLKVEAERRDSRKQIQKTIEAKKRRREHYYKLLKEKTAKAREDIRNGIGYYRSAVNKANEAEDEPRTKKQRKEGTNQCRCGSTTHQRTTSRQCPLNRMYLESTPAQIAQYEEDKKDQELMDFVGIDDMNIAESLNELED
jgi:hypothetical protein